MIIDRYLFNRSIRSLISGSYKVQDVNRVPGVYELLLKEPVDSGSPGTRWCMSRQFFIFIFNLYFLTFS